MKKQIFFFLAVTGLLYGDGRLQDKFYGYHKYKTVEKKDDNKTVEKPIDLSKKALDKMTAKEIAELTEKLRGIAVVNPTSENITNQLTLIKYNLDKSSEYSKNLQLVTMQNPELDSALGTKQNNVARFIDGKNEQDNLNDFFLKNKENMALIVFVNGVNFQENKAQENIINMLKYDYPIEVKYFQLEDEKIRSFIKKKNLKLGNTPDLFLFFFNNKNKKEYWLRIGSGVLAGNRIIQKIDFLYQNIIEVDR